MSETIVFLCRHNANGFDLNQNVPDAFRERKVERQNETEHVIKWISSIPFALSANVHTGAMVAVYPYNSLTKGIKGRVIDTNGNPIKGASVYIKGRDNILPYNTTADGEYYQLLLTGRYTILQELCHFGNLHGGALVANYGYDNIPDEYHQYWHTYEDWYYGRLDPEEILEHNTPDHDVFLHISKVYSYTHANMWTGSPCPQEMNASFHFVDGIVNGAAWYPIVGSMQDYNYMWGQCLEVTLEVSCCKYPPVEELQHFWWDNRDALIQYLKQGHLGIKGQVFDEMNNTLSGARVQIDNRETPIPFNTSASGEYYRLLLSGTYKIKVLKEGYHQSTVTITLKDTSSYPYGATVLNFILKKADVSVKPNPTVTPSSNKYSFSSGELTGLCIGVAIGSIVCGILAFCLIKAHISTLTTW
ncbi:hypothetical protein scyTo_0004822 [Scyliorhinus torazame]|uniref:Peptidase M14 domain-containing protein n=1 Tax=Scyliorhinus torazame TaxID=75743 RepID=A0A401NXL6_SCYTO|nr:hypothetical protein [Scyliorhinus torazame]